MPWGRVLGAALDAVGGVVWGAMGVGAGGCGGAVGGVVWGAVGVGAGSCYEAHRASHLGAAPKPPLGILLIMILICLC